jgi:hypothetical protein
VEFARLSGDWNPLHVDPLAARRTLFGATVVHGMHATLAALDHLIALAGESRALSSIHATYSASLHQNQAARLEIDAGSGDTALLRLHADGALAQTIRVEWAQGASATGPRPGGSLPPEEAPDVLDFAAAASARGAVPALVDMDLAGRLFPSLVRYLPCGQLAAMLAATRIVGMRCPGMHSILSGVKLAFDVSQEVGEFSYAVRRHSAEANYLVLTLQGCGVKGEITAFFRPVPVSQPEFARLRDLVDHARFADRTALVIGGSRGLGELCAKILAAGGAAVILTWHIGESDAARVVEDIRNGGGRAETLRWDCTHPPAEVPDRLRAAFPTHFYYFATPRIELNRTGHFDRSLFEKYADTYVVGLERSFTAARQLWAPSNLKYLFVPSSVFLDQPEPATAEYAAAKAAAEVTARVIAARAGPGMVIDLPRLPRVLTDQTATVSTMKAKSAVDVMLTTIR